MEGNGELGAPQALDILRQASDPILVVDATATIVWANDAVRSLDWEPADLLGRSALDLLGAEEVERAVAAMAAIASGYPPPSSAPFIVPTGTGATVECDVAGWVLGDPTQPDGIAVHLRPTQDSRVLRHLLQRLLAGDSAVAVLDDMRALLYHRNPYVRVLLSFSDEDGVPRMVGDDLDPRLGGAGATADSPWARAAADGEQQLVEDHAELPAPVAALAAAAGLGDCWILPVRAEDQPVATITVWVLEGGPPARLDVYSVTLLAQLTELVLQWRSQTRALERAATRDPLTGLPNRRALGEFDERGPRRDLGVLFVDLDHFKPVNDRLGHAAGDIVLRTVAARLQSVVRPTDIVARLGGDEFGVICPGCSREELDELAERAHALLAEAMAVHDHIVVVDASIGVAIGHDSVAPLLERADRALYDAKASGRGTIRWAPDPTS